MYTIRLLIIIIILPIGAFFLFASEAHAITPENGRAAFVAAWDPDIYWVLDTTDLGTNYGDSVAAGDDNTLVSSGDITTIASWSGMNNRNDDGSGSDFDIDLTNDSAFLLYIPAGLTHDTSYGLWHNGGNTNAQATYLRATATGVEIACNHNNANGSADLATSEIADASLPGWFMIGCQFNSNGGSEGDMALWIDGAVTCSGTRTYTLDYGSGDPDFGFASSNDPDAADAVCAYGGTDHGTTDAIDSTGILIANFTADNPSGGASDTSAGNGDSYYTDYYDMHTASADVPAGPVGQPRVLRLGTLLLLWGTLLIL